SGSPQGVFRAVQVVARFGCDAFAVVSCAFSLPLWARAGVTARPTTPMAAVSAIDFARLFIERSPCEEIAARNAAHQGCPLKQASKAGAYSDFFRVSERCATAFAWRSREIIGDNDSQAG